MTGSGSAVSRRPSRAPWGQGYNEATPAQSGGARSGGGQGRGTVKWFNAQKGLGFIQPDDGSTDVFVHVSAVEQAGIQDLREGEVLTYDLEQSRNGKTSAINLRFAEIDS